MFVDFKVISYHIRFVLKSSYGYGRFFLTKPNGFKASKLDLGFQADSWSEFPTVFVNGLFKIVYYGIPESRV